MKTLRILTGIHAGAQRRLSPGRCRITRAGAPEGVDSSTASTQGCATIALYDWPGEEAWIDMPDDGGPAVLLQAMAKAESWTHLEVRRFGHVVLCLGGADAAWPSDAQLLSRLTASPAQSRRPFMWRRMGFLAAGLMAAVSALSGKPDLAREDTSARGPLTIARLQQQMHDQGFAGLRVGARPGGLVVDGLVRDGHEADVLAHLLTREHASVQSTWQSADDLVATLDGAFRNRALRTTYLGDGRFRVEGTVRDPEAVRAAAARIKADLGPNVRAIELQLEPRHKALAVMSAVTADALSYFERPDGAKTFQPSSP